MLSGQVPDTGSLRRDVLALLRRASAGLREIGPEVISGLLTDRLAIDSLPRIQADVFQVGTGVMAAILRHAAEWGEIQDGIPPRVVTLPTDLFRHELFITQCPPEDQAIIEIVDDVFLPRVLAQTTQHGQLFARDVRPALESLAQSRKSKDDNHGTLSRAPPGTVHLPGNQPAESCSTTAKHPAHGVQVHLIPTPVRAEPCTWPRGLPAHRQAPQLPPGPGAAAGGSQRHGRDQRGHGGAG
jgi:hypothetical protein